MLFLEILKPTVFTLANDSPLHQDSGETLFIQDSPVQIN